MGNLDSFIDFIFLLAGVYSIFFGINAKKAGKIISGPFVSKRVDFEHVKDKEGYIKYITPKAIIAGMVFALYGALNLADRYVFPINDLIQTVALGIVVIDILAFGYILTNGEKKYLV